MADALDKLSALAEAARDDVCEPGKGTSATPSRRQRPDARRFIHRAVLPQGGCVNLFKVLQTNYCDNDCTYCQCRHGLDVRRFALSPDELASTFIQLVGRGEVLLRLLSERG